jgi:hypothetical protein
MVKAFHVAVPLNRHSQENKTVASKILFPFPGSVFPSGCHRHPSRLLSGPPPSTAAPVAAAAAAPGWSPSPCRRCGGGASRGRCVCHLDSSERGTRGVAVQTNHSSPLLPLASDKSYSKDDSNIRPTTWSSSSAALTRDKQERSGERKDRSREGEKENGERSQPGNSDSILAAQAQPPVTQSRFGAGRVPAQLSRLQEKVVGSGNRILRRHTTYIKTPPEGETTAGGHSATRHVHSWHKQVIDSRKAVPLARPKGG